MIEIESFCDKCDRTIEGVEDIYCRVCYNEALKNAEELKKNVSRLEGEIDNLDIQVGDLLEEIEILKEKK